MKYVLKISFAVLFFAIFSCTKDAKVKIPNQTPIPVVGCFFKSGDTLISLQLSFSQPLYASSPVPKETTAFVKVEGPTDNKILTYNPMNEKYEVKINPNFFQFGQKYSLYIKLSNGKEITSESTMPNKIVSIKKISSEFTNVSAGYIEYKIRVTFDDEANVVNYYALSSAKLYKNFPLTDTLYSQNQFLTSLITDNNKDGGELTLSTTYYADGDTTASYGNKISLLNCSKEYYLYTESFNKYTNSGGGNGNPFAEPSFVYSNIKNGLGIFAAYTQTNKFYKP